MKKLSVFFLIFLLIACGKDEPQSEPEAFEPIVFNYLALGDSYTIGTGLPSDTGRYPLQLSKRLDIEEDLIAGETRIIAQNGWTTGNLISALNSANIDTTYALVSLLIGVNNQFQNRPEEEYAEQFEELLNRCIQFAGNDTSRVFVLSIPDYGVTPFGASYPNASAGVDAFNAINQEITENYGISYFYITDISRMAENQPELLASDSLHPSAEMYRLWVNDMYNEVKTKLHE
jgi:lysophospholipase L1-like esterase